jgi:aspartoacylase
LPKARNSIQEDPNRKNIMINRLTIIGGTHGNEVTGIYLLRRWAANPTEIARESFATSTLWANPKAFYENKRYIDVDLNRSFLIKELYDETIITYEGNRAKAINTYLGPKENPAVDLLIDIHTTTSNMGVTLMLFEGDDEFNFRLAAFIKSHMPQVNLYLSQDGSKDLPYLVSITQKRLVLEIGPVPQGVLRHDVFEQANRVVQLALDYVHSVNIGSHPRHENELEVFVHKSAVSFPLDDAGNICGMVHRDLQDRDFTILKKGDPLFIKLNGDILRFDGDEPSYPVFINEAAYYDKKIALSLTEKAMRKMDPHEPIS